MERPKLPDSLPTPDWCNEEFGIALYNRDCLELLPQIPDSCIDAVVTDPPYVFGLGSLSSGKSTCFGDIMNQSVFIESLILKFRDACGKDGAIWMFFNWRGMPVLMKAAADAKQKIESLLIWDKQWIGPGGSVGLRPSYEVCALIPFGDFRLPNRGLPDIWRSKWSSHKPNGHPAEKPIDLLQRIVHETPANVVADPFFGSGTTAVACINTNRAFIGCEISADYFKIAVKRIKDAIEKIKGGALFAEPNK